jgi:hypothetical protein
MGVVAAFCLSILGLISYVCVIKQRIRYWSTREQVTGEVKMVKLSVCLFEYCIIKAHGGVEI